MVEIGRIAEEEQTAAALIKEPEDELLSKKKKKKKKKKKGPKPKKWKPHGADVLRLWAAASDYSHDVVIGPKVIEKSSDSLRKIRNTARFVLGNISDFDVAEDSVPYEEMSPLDRLMLHRTAMFLDDVKVCCFHRSPLGSYLRAPNSLTTFCPSRTLLNAQSMMLGHMDLY